MKKIIATISVRMEITFSAPLSFVLTKTLRPPPVIAPEAPSDLPPCNKHKTIMMMLVTSKTQSYHASISFSPFALIIVKKLNDLINHYFQLTIQLMNS